MPKGLFIAQNKSSLYKAHESECAIFSNHLLISHERSPLKRIRLPPSEASDHTEGARKPVALASAMVPGYHMWPRS